MMSRHFGLSSELSGAMAKNLQHAINQLSAPDSLINQFVTYIYIYTVEIGLFCPFDCTAKTTK